MTQMAAEHGLAVAQSFNYEYDKYLPQAKGHVLLIETHNGVPIVPADLLEKYFPTASQGLHNGDGTAKIGDTTIIFVEFSTQLRGIEAGAGKKQQLTSPNKSDEEP